MQESTLITIQNQSEKDQPRQWSNLLITKFFIKEPAPSREESIELIWELASRQPDLLSESFLNILGYQPSLLATFYQVAEKMPVIEEKLNNLTKRNIAYILNLCQRQSYEEEVSSFSASLKTHPILGQSMSPEELADLLVDLELDLNWWKSHLNIRQKVTIIFESLKLYSQFSQLNKESLLRILCKARKEVVEALFGWDEDNQYPLRELIYIYTAFNSAEINQIFNQASAEVIDLLYRHCQPAAEMGSHVILPNQTSLRLSHLSNEKICKLFWGRDFYNNNQADYLGELPFPEQTQSVLITALLTFTYIWFGQLDVQEHIGNFFQQKLLNNAGYNLNNLMVAQCELLIALYKHVAGKKDPVSQNAYQSLLTYLAKPLAPFIITLLIQKPEDAKIIVKDENLLNALNDEAVLRIFAATPACLQKLSQKLFAKVSDWSIEDAIVNINNLFPQDPNQAAKARSAFLLNLFLNANNDQNKLNELKQYFSVNPKHFGAIFSYSDNEKSNFSPDNLLKLAKTIITDATHPELIRNVFLELHPDCLEVGELLLSYLTPKEILKVFIEAETENGLFPLVNQLLLKKLDFQSLPSVVKELESEWVISVASAKNLIATLYKTKYQLQEERFGLVEFGLGLLSFFYGLIYYGSVVLGPILHFAAPSTRPTEIYRRLKEFFIPPEIIKESIAPPSYFDPDFGSEKVTFASMCSYAKVLKAPKENLLEEDLENSLEQSNISRVLLGKHDTLKKVVSGNDVYLTPFHKQRIETKYRFVKQQEEEYIESIKEEDESSIATFFPKERKYVVWDAQYVSKKDVNFSLDALNQNGLDLSLEINRSKERTHYGLK